MNTIFPRPEYLNEPHAFLFFGFFLGCIFLMCFNELVVYRTDRSRDAVWYSGFFISLSGILFITGNWPQALWGISTGAFEVALYYFFFCGGIICGNIFVRNVFSIRLISKRLDRFIVFSVCLDVVYFLVSVSLLPFPKTTGPYMLTGIPVGIFHTVGLLWTTVVLIKKRVPGTVYYLAGYGCTMIGTWMYVLSTFDSTYENAFFGGAMYFGLLLNGIFHSLVLREQAARNVRERKLMREKLSEAERLGVVGLLTSSLAHDIANPLAVISNDVTLLAQDFPILRQEAADSLPDDSNFNGVEPQIFFDRFDESIRSIDTAQKKISILLSHLRSYNQGSLANAASEEFDPAECTASVLGFMKGIFKRDGLKLKFKNEAPPCLINMNRIELERALSNILINAVQALEKKERDALIIVSVIQEKAAVVISVSDNGPGMDQVTQEQAGTLFFSTKGKNGSGLGLYMTRKVVEEAGGSVVIQSVTGNGCAVRVSLPRIK
jgi:signal transduction histidine kinase